jgi:hypothetical protein
MLPHAQTAPQRAPLPDPLELLRLGLEGVTMPLPAFERWFDRLEGTR